MKTREKEPNRGIFLPGDIVKNMRNDKKSGMGVLIERSNTHKKYWKVLTSEDVVTWFESNIAKVDSKTCHKFYQKS
jgi:hypothetical protein